MDVKAEPIEAKTTLTPPASEEADKQDDSGSDLSDLELDPEDSGEIAPDHYYEGGKIPVFKPVCRRLVTACCQLCHRLALHALINVVRA